MDLSKLLRQLRSELEHLDEAIHSLEQLQAREKQRGSPSNALVEIRGVGKAGKARRRPARKNLIK